MLNRPKFIPADVAVPELNYKWNNSIAVSLGGYEGLPQRLSKAIDPVNYKGAMALALACLEWALWRIDGRTDINDPLQRIEAAWASTVSPMYARSLDSKIIDELNQNANPDGLRQAVLKRLDHLHFHFVRSRTNLCLETPLCPNLAQYVLPKSAGFEAWLQQTLVALAVACPKKPKSGGYERTFDHSAEPPVARAWFESPAVPFDNNANREAWDIFLRGLDPGKNPYLVPADEMKANGFTGEPYRIN